MSEYNSVRNRLELTSLSRNPESAIKQICQYMIDNADIFITNVKGNVERTQSYNWHCNIVRSAARKIDISDEIDQLLGMTTLEKKPNERSRGDVIRQFSAILDKMILREADNYFAKVSEESVINEFDLNEDDISKIFELTAKMRSIVSVSDFFDPSHSRRLLSRISQIEKEVSKVKGNFDVILGGIVDLGEACGKAGTKAKPLVDLIGQVRKIAQGRTGTYDELEAPEETKQLPKPEDFE